MEHISKTLGRLTLGVKSAQKSDGAMSFAEWVDSGGFAKVFAGSDNRLARPRSLAEAVQGAIESASAHDESGTLKVRRSACQAECDGHNRIPGSLDGGHCGKCNGRGYIMKPVFSQLHKDFIATGFDCECKPARMAKSRLEKSGVGPLLKRCTLDNFDTSHGAWQQSMVDLAAKYTVEAHTGLWFFIGGDAGSGKSHLCAGIMRELLDQDMPCAWMDWGDDSTRVINGWRSDYDAALKPWREAKVLIVDDFLKTVRSSRSSAPLPTADTLKLAYSIVNYRYNNPSLVTIFSSEHTLEKIMGFDEAIGSRIEHRCGKMFKIANDYQGGRNVRHEYDFRGSFAPEPPEEFVDESLYGV